MNNKIFKAITSVALSGALMFGAVGCTDEFENFNTNPKNPTPEQMEGDYASTAALINTMIPVLQNGQENDFQMLDQMVGYEYGRMLAAKNQWGSGAYFATYDPPQGWIQIPFNTTMPDIYTSFFKIRDISGGVGLTYYWANFLRVVGTLRVSDMYGPTPFSLIGTGDSYTVAYDDMPDLYNAMFKTLDEAIAGLKESVGSSITTEIFGNADAIYQGDIAKWVKLANTFKLRMAMRIVNANPALAKQKAEEAVSDAGGLVESVAETAYTTIVGNGNSLWKVTEGWEEGRVSADITSYMNGYNDPRIGVYCAKASDGTYKGARNGVYHYDNNDFIKYSLTNYKQESPTLLVMSAAESWFLRAEGALRGWNMGGNAKDLYEQGVQVSMAERGVQIGNYLSVTSGPEAYTALETTAYNATPATDICPMYDESASFEKNLERIIVQKWLASFPNGWEAWNDFRRTGYPIWFPVVNNRSVEGVTAARGMRRLSFPQSEFNTNEANVKAAVGMLGGPDTGATDLWWAKKN